MTTPPLNHYTNSVNPLLTEEELDQERAVNEQKRALEQQEQESKDALEKAHYSFPKTCNPKTCEYCDNEQKRRYEDEQFAYAAKMTKLYGHNWRVNTGSPPGFT